MASQSKTKTVKFEVGQLVLFSGPRMGRVSRIAKNGAIYVVVLGETTVADQTREELRVKKADLQLVDDVLERTGDAARVRELVGIDLVKLANLYTGKKVEVGEAAKPIEDAIQSIDATIQSIEEAAQQPSVVPESIEPMVAPIEEPIQSALLLESTEESPSLADATYALRELTFSVTRHSILTAFIDMALNKNIPGYHYQVASNIKNLMAAAFDPVHDSVGYARINTWTMAALKLVVKNKDRVAKMLSQPIEAAPIKMDRVTKLGMWIDNMMSNIGSQVNDMPSAYDSCYVYDAMGKKLHACTFVVVGVIQSGDQGGVSAIPLPTFGKESTPFQEYLTAQSAIARRQQCIDCYRPTEPDLHLYCGIVPILKTGLPMQVAIESVIDDAMASVIGRLK